jgi:hypothetical protein
MEHITQAERENAANCLAITRAEVINAVISFNAEQLDFKPGPQRWSIAETVQHLMIVDKLVLGMAANAGSATTTEVSAWNGRDDELLSRVRDRSEKMQAPEIGIPSAGLPAVAAIAEFEAGRNALILFIRNTQVPLRRHTIPHPIFGNLDCYQWILSLGAHAERHLKQIRETIDSPLFPGIKVDTQFEQTTQSQFAGSASTDR